MLETFTLVVALLLTGSGTTNDARNVIIDTGQTSNATASPSEGPPPPENDARAHIIDIG